MGGAILHQIVRLEMPSCPSPFRVQSDNCVWLPFVFRFSFLFAISRDIHTVAVYVAVLMELASAELCELSKPGALLKWVGVPEANAPAIRKEWFSMFGASETGAASVIVRLPPDQHKAMSARMRIAELAEAKHLSLHVFCLYGFDGL